MTRKEAIEILKKHHMWTGEPSEVVDVRLENKALQMAIASLETDEAYQLMYEEVEVKPVIHGEWLGTEYNGYSDGFPVYTTWKCSNCGAEFECEDMDFYYCPNCGAKMDKENKDE